MSARTIAAVVVIAGIVVGGGALAIMGLSDPSPGEQPDVAEPDSGSSTALVDSAPEDVPRRASDAAPPPADGEPWVRADGYDEALAAIPWPDVGAAYAELVPLLEAHVRAVNRGTDLSAADSARIDELWSELDTYIEPLRERVDYVWGNGVFAHPAYQANAVAATLHARGSGLTREQLDELAQAVAHDEEGEEFIVDLKDDPMLVGTMRAMVELEARRGFSDHVQGLLSERQQRLLHRDELFGRVGVDPFHGVEVVRGRMAVILFDDESDAAEGVVDLLMQEVPADGLRRDDCLSMARPWTQLLSRDLFPEGARRLDRAGHVDIERAIMSARLSGESVQQMIQVLAGGDMPLIPPEALNRPIIVVRTSND